MSQNATSTQGAGPAQSPVAGTIWAGRIISTLPAVFLLVDVVMKFAKPTTVVQATVQLGYPERVITGLGILLLICSALYLIPRTAVFGAVLLTGYLGGAIASQVRVGNPVFTHVLFPVYLGAFIWSGLFLRRRSLLTMMFTTVRDTMTETSHRRSM